MTAMNFFHMGDRAAFMIDGAWLSPDGTIGHIGEKGLPIPKMGGFLAFSGQGGIDLTIDEMVLSEFADIDALADHGEGSFRAVYERKLFGPRQWTVLVAGWSPQLNAARAVAFSSCDDGYFEKDVRQWFEPFPPDDRLRELFASIVATGGRSSFDVRTHGRLLMEMQRAKQLKDYAPGAHFVGGFIEAVEITREGVSIEVIHRWPDQVGEMIKPEPYREHRRAVA